VEMVLDPIEYNNNLYTLTSTFKKPRKKYRKSQITKCECGVTCIREGKRGRPRIYCPKCRVLKIRESTYASDQKRKARRISSKLKLGVVAEAGESEKNSDEGVGDES
jgi:hypothetical protein